MSAACFALGFITGALFLPALVVIQWQIERIRGAK